jgi:chemotaxis protein MotB
MMAFFLVMWLVGQSPSVKGSVAAYFQDPSGFMKAVNSGGKIVGSGGGGNSVINIMPHVANKPRELTDQELEKKLFQRTKASVEKMIAQYPEFKSLAKSVQIRIAEDGMRIDLMDSSGDIFFDAGSAHTKPRTNELLSKIAAKVGELPNRVIIEGHTDSRPYHGPNGWSNWELSTARANSARSVMEATGLKRGQMAEVRGLADRVPFDPKHRDSFKNRRVSILIPFKNSAGGIPAKIKQ